MYIFNGSDADEQVIRMKQDFSISRVVTKDIITDTFQGFRNFFGLRLRGYERMLNKSTDALIEEMNLKYNVEWWRLSINPLTNGSAMITVYGRGEPL